MSNAAARSVVEKLQDPVFFSTEVLGMIPWKRQSDVLRSVSRSIASATRSGHKVSKSTSAATLALQFVSVYPDARVILTAPTDRQVNEILWHELKRLYRKSKAPIGGHLNESAQGGLRFADGRAIFGFSTKEPERMAGISGANLLFLVDEASGVDARIFEAIKGNMAGGARLAMFSNPTQTSGEFYDAFHTKRGFWDVHHISSLEAAETGISGLATKEWCERCREEWGPESPLYQVRVEGNFPSQAENAIIGIALVEAAVARWADMGKSPSRLELGVDPARFGDDESVIFPRRGLKAGNPLFFRNLDGIQLAGKALEIARKYKIRDERPRIKVDAIGIGASVVDQLRQADEDEEIELVEVNCSESANNDEKYFNLRSELAFGVAEWLKSGGAIPNDSKLLAELVAPTYSFDLRGRQKVEPKDDIKKRIGRSPDRADALALAVYSPPERSNQSSALDYAGDFEDQNIGL